MRPGPEVLASFGARADPVPLPGGEGTTWRAGEMVLKPAGDPRVARWTAEVYRTLADRPRPGFRVPRPVRSATGDWIAADSVNGDPPAADSVNGDPASAWAVGDQVARPSSMSWPVSRNSTSCWPARWYTGSSPRSSSAAATRPAWRRSRGAASR